MGDSLSAGYNMKIQSSWPSLLQKNLDALNKNTRVINASISGETTFGGNHRINDLLTKHQPNIVIIELGGNDGLRGLNMKISQQNINVMIKAAQNIQAQVLMIGVRLPPNLGQRYNDKFQAMYQSIADSQQLYYLPKFLSGVAEHKELMQKDGIHPVAKAQPLLKDKVLKALLMMQ